MRYKTPHQHLCPDCEQPVTCPGEWEQNHDGLSWQFCPIYERHREPLCEDCAERRQQAIRDEARVENDR